eukprot:1045854-Rhodomonas_salina.1
MAQAKKLRGPVSGEEAARAHHSGYESEEDASGVPSRLFEAFVVSGLSPSTGGAGKGKEGEAKL